jgi:hypothetical protein
VEQLPAASSLTTKSTKKDRRDVLSPHPAGGLHRQDKILFLFVIFVHFVVNWFLWINVDQHSLVRFTCSTINEE